MKATDNNLSRFLRLEDTRFYIPVYQRNYDWKREQCDQLLKDILDNYNENPNKEYFIGSIVYTSNSQTTKRDFIIIDGQQRITTINLMLLAIARILEKAEDPLAGKIWQKYIRNEDERDDNKLKLKHNQRDYTEYECLVSENYNRIRPGSRIYENYKFFLNKITSPEMANKLYEAFLLLSFVEIGLSQDDDAQKVFQSLNSTGLDLSQADLIRNYVLMKHTPKKQEEIFNKYWSVIEDNTKDKYTFEIKTSTFFKDYITFKFSKIPNERDIFEEFRIKFDLNSKSDDEYYSILDDLRLFSSYYFQIINPEEIFDLSLRKEFKKLSKLENTVTYPFLLGIFHDYETGKINSSEFIEILKLIQSYILRRFICNYPTNALRSLFSSLYQNIKNIHKKFPELNFIKSMEVVLVQLSRANSLTFPDDSQLFSSLQTRDVYKMPSKYKHYILETLENNFHNFNESEFSFSNPLPLSIEHIFPQNPSKEWKMNLSLEEYSEMEARCGSLGNLTVVINNASLGNRPFLYKRDLNLPDSKGFKYSKFNLNSTLSNLDKWSLDELNSRHKELYEIAIRIWKYPTVEEKYIGVISDEIEISIDEIDDLENKSLKAIVIDGTKFEIASYREAFRKLVTYIYTKEPEIFYTPEIKNVLKISSNENELIAAIKIADELFFEGNYSANDIVSKMKKLLEFTDIISDIKLKFKSKNNNLLTNGNKDLLSETGNLNEDEEYQFWERFKKYCSEKKLDYNFRGPNRYGLEVLLNSKLCFIHLQLYEKDNSLSCEIFIPDNKNFYNYLYNFSQEINSKMGVELDWRDAPRLSKAKYRFQVYKLFEIENDEKNFNLLVDNIELFKKVFVPYLEEYKG